jgi:hypothetical protein
MELVCYCANFTDSSVLKARYSINPAQLVVWGTRLSHQPLRAEGTLLYMIRCSSVSSTRHV